MTPHPSTSFPSRVSRSSRSSRARYCEHVCHFANSNRRDELQDHRRRVRVNRADNGRSSRRREQGIRSNANLATQKLIGAHAQSTLMICTGTLPVAVLSIPPPGMLKSGFTRDGADNASLGTCIVARTPGSATQDAVVLSTHRN